MSIYSGFATRNLQQTYDHCVNDMLFILQKRILKFYQNIDTDQDKFWLIFSQLHNQITHLQKTKYLEPKSSQSLTEIYQYLKIQKQQREQDPQQDLKKFERSMGIRLNPQSQIKLKSDQINTFMKRSSISFGKIKRQLDLANQTGQSIQRNEPTQKQKSKRKLVNPSTNKITQRQSITSIGKRKAKSFRQQFMDDFSTLNAKPQSRNGAQMVVKNYLQKTNKVYLKGSQKRKVNQYYLQSLQNSIDLRNFSNRKNF